MMMMAALVPVENARNELSRLHQEDAEDEGSNDTVELIGIGEAMIGMVSSAHADIDAGEISTGTNETR